MRRVIGIQECGVAVVVPCANVVLGLRGWAAARPHGYNRPAVYSPPPGHVTRVGARGPMKFARKNLPKSLGLAVLTTALLVAGVARADEYGDVNQLLRSGKLTDALNKADQYLAGKPKDPQMRFLKGVVLTEAGRINEAIGTF